MENTLEKIVERDLLIIELERIAKKPRSPIDVLIDEQTGYDKELIKQTIEMAERLIALNDDLGIENDGSRSPRELVKELQKLLTPSK